MWNVLRLGAFFLVVPIFGNQLVPARVRLVMTIVIALALTPVLPPAPELTAFHLGMLVPLMLEMLTALGLAFSALIFFQLFVVAGQFIGMQMGLGFAAMVDPGNGIQVTVWSQFFLMLATLSFLALDAHLLLVQLLVEGYRLATVSADSLSMLAQGIVQLGGWMFKGGLLLAIPAVTALLIVNIAFGVMNRSAPQLNVFSLGFPFSLLFGLVVIWVLLFGWIDQFEGLLSEYMSIFHGLRGL
ncbi:MAG: flagellar biosynthetic protein FliR [Pseudomonadota bacterium]